MKNKFILILFSILCACSNDDAPDANDTELLIGEWRITQRIIDGSQSTLGECEPFNVYTYNADGTYTELLYAAVANTECLDNPSIEFNGSWQKNSATSYSFTNSNNESSDVMIVFSSNNSFTITIAGLSNPNDPVIQTIVENYERLE